MNENVLRIINANQAMFCYQLYYHLNSKDKIKIHSIQEQPNTFIFQYENLLTTYGHKATVEKLLSKLSKEIDGGTRYQVLFQHHHLKSISAVFQDFDFIEESVNHKDGINRLQVMQLEKSQFLPKRQLKSGKRIKAELLEHFDPDLAEYAKTGVVYGIIEDTELISVCPVPFIHKDFNYSFAILHEIYTKEVKRKKGYATGSVRAALNFLFTRKAIKNVYIAIDEDNVGVNMLEKIGFERTGGEWLGSYAFLK